MSNADGSPSLEPFMDDYFSECDEHLLTVRGILLDAERHQAQFSPRQVDELFRSFHTLKGLSAMVGLHDAERLAHQMESYLRLLRDTARPSSMRGVVALTRGAHAFEEVVAAKQTGDGTPAVDEVLAELDALTESTEPAAAHQTLVEQRATERWQVLFEPSAALAAQGIGVDRVRGLLRESAEILEAAPRVDASGAISFEFIVEGDVAHLARTAPEHGLTITPIVPPAAAAAIEPEPLRTSISGSHFVRVDLSRLDDLMRMLGDLVISRARLAESLARIEARIPPVEFRPVQENASLLERQLRDLRDGVMRVRLVRVGEIFRRMPFVVRDLSQETGREVQLEMTGQDTEIDKFVVERLLDPILHLVRNAVSHGIETPDARAAAGKSRVGRLTLNAATVGDVVVLEVADDGRGIDREAVIRRARAVGIAVPAGDLDSDALLNLICTPGFSTRDEADRASGRGVGMAVVQSTVQELGGRLTLDTLPGQGARFTLEVPVTLSITDALLGQVGAQTFAIPQNAVREVLEVDPAQLRRVERHELTPYRDGALPIVRLADLFGLQPVPRRALHVFVIGHGASAAGLAVDRIIGQREVVVRPLSDTLIKVDGVVGATDLGDGRAVLILDPTRLVTQAGTRRRGTSPEVSL